MKRRRMMLLSLLLSAALTFQSGAVVMAASGYRTEAVSLMDAEEETSTAEDSNLPADTTSVSADDTTDVDAGTVEDTTDVSTETEVTSGTGDDTTDVTPGTGDDTTDPTPATGDDTTDPTPATGDDTTDTEPQELTGKWVKKSGKYYWKWSDGTTITKKGWQTLNGKTYYLTSGGARVSGFKTIDGKRYYFHSSSGTLYTTRGFKTINKRKYYFLKDHSVAVGLRTLSGKRYYFSSKGVLRKNLRAVKIDGKYYNVSAKGVATKLTQKEALCELAAQKFIKKHGGSGTNAQKFRKCFNYLEAYMAYNAGYYTWSGDKKYFDYSDGKYDLALQTFNSPNLRGNCHRFACCIAAIAKELGYKAYVLTTTGDHSFVIINGKYYDNMGAKFASSTHSSYTTYKKQLM